MMISFPSLIYLASVVGTIALAKPTPSRRQTPPEMCTTAFDPNEAYDWNNSQGIGLSDGIQAGSGILKGGQPRPLFKFTKVDSSPASWYIQ